MVDGPALAALACVYVNAINIPGALPDLEQGWFAVIKLKLKEFSDQLVSEYEREMEVSLRGNLPMEESNLTRIHEQTLSRKQKSLQQETHRLDPLGFSSEDQEPLQSRLEQTVVRRNEEGNVVGGVLFQFTTQNYSTSKQQCEEVFQELVKKYEVYKKYQDADRCCLQREGSRASSNRSTRERSPRTQSTQRLPQENSGSTNGYLYDWKRT